MIKVLFGLNLISHSLNILTICSSSFIGIKVPILSISGKIIASSIFSSSINDIFISPMISGFSYVDIYVDPLPQALVLTSIVINIATASIFLSIINYFKTKLHTTDTSNIQKLKG